MVSTLIDGVISLGLGLWAALLGFGVVAISKDAAKSEEWFKKWGVFMNIAGPLIMLWGIYNIVRGLKS